MFLGLADKSRFSAAAWACPGDRTQLRSSMILAANSGAQPDQATMRRAANRKIHVFAEAVKECRCATQRL
jgi:hypothetical protein